MSNSANRVIYIIGKVFAVFLIISIISGIVQAVLSVGNVAFRFNNKEISFSDSNAKEVAITDGNELVIDADFADIIISQGEKFSYKTENKYITVETTGNKIIVKEKNHSVSNGNAQPLYIVLPEGKSFDKVDVDMGAGSFRADRLETDKLDIDIGAGNVIIKSGYIKNGKIDTGAGNIEVNAKLEDEFKTSSGVGNTKITVQGTSDDYTVDVSKGLGNVTVDGKVITKDSIIGSGKNEIKLDGGVGEITLEFDS